MPFDLLQRKRTHFVLWRPGRVNPPPALVIGTFLEGNPPSFQQLNRFDLAASPVSADLWEVAAAACGLANNRVYHYWFEVTNANPKTPVSTRILCTDPTAWTVDWRLRAPALPLPFTDDDRGPAAVVKWRENELVPCDPAGDEPDWQNDPRLEGLPGNNHLVIYELPTRWSRIETEGTVSVASGTFRDILALIERTAAATNFAGVAALAPGEAHLEDLGVNALELLPPADSFVNREWGYATSNYFAADFDLGFPRVHASPTASADLAALVTACHRHRLRFFADVVMAFATRYAYRYINFLDFHIHRGTGDPEEDARDDFGGDLFKYNFLTDAYDPIAGGTARLVPARRLMLTCLAHWMLDFRIDGIRIDSVPNIMNWDFVQEYKDLARAIWRSRWLAQGLLEQVADERFLVVGEDLAVPIDLVRQNRLDGLWNEEFKRMVRYAIMGRNDEKEPSFEWTVRKLIDCRLLGFADGSQAINYVTSHDVEGVRNERLYNLLNNNGVWNTERRIKLAFVCLMTAVGIPMIFAGEEFADQHDLAVVHPQKQVDPVNFDRLQDTWRRRVFDYCARLVRFRTRSDALAVNDTQFIHVDFEQGKRVLVWRRGRPGIDHPVVVVANFSDFETALPFAPASEYRVPNWPTTPTGMHWREVTQDRNVPLEWAGREPIFPWEAKVYALT
ncbi:alpha amylase [Bradyrhizobium sp. 190]|uniref:alpha-amylase family glycosyl hydrolase n=1 Tax=Bradyrhizobium sp. 190 TaxID=2782658 RepID=UPI001FF95327|nr:alpha-amylase family glycosyl hydrolase [Bradyrhizobium sp. 190]MCK1512560.1 alpha amylase [Bradyrhizobium sp. 190]